MNRPDDRHPDDRHPDDRLLAYALGELSEAESAELDAHLDGCADCRAELRRLRATLVEVVEKLPPVAPPSGTWQAIADRVAAAPPRRAPAAPAPQPVLRDRSWPRWPRFALAASLALLLLTGLWGLDGRRQLQALRSEALTVNRWLARQDLQVSYLEPTSTPVGSVLFLADGRALLVLTETPPARSSYQAWGLRDGQAFSLGVGDGRTLEIDSSGFENIGISLEPAGGSDQPTNVLGVSPVL